MGKIVISENVTLDGVVQDPAGAEGFGRGGWVGRVGERGREEAAKVLLDEALGAVAQLFGRRTYEFLAGRWPSRSGELADRLNDMPKYVVSSTLKDPDWNNSTVLEGDVMQEVSKLSSRLFVAELGAVEHDEGRRAPLAERLDDPTRARLERWRRGDTNTRS